MKSALLVPVRRKSTTNSMTVDLRLELGTNMAATEDATVKTPDSPRQPSMSLASETPATESVAESASELAVYDGTGKAAAVAATRPKRGSATMRSFLQRVMRSQSDSHIRIAPIAYGGAIAPLDRSLETRAHDRDDDEGQSEDTAVDVNPKALTDECDPLDTRDAGPIRDVDVVGNESEAAVAAAADATLCDVFLNSSLQLLQVQSDAKQRVRQLWTCAQRLRWENQLSDAGLELLHQELLNVMKALTVEKLDGARHIKAGYLTLVQAPPAVVAANLMQRGAAAATKSLLFGTGGRGSLDQRVWVSLSEEQCRMELVPSAAARADERPPLAVPPAQVQPNQSTPATSSDAAAPPATTFPGLGKFKLPTSISWLLSDPMQPHQAKDDDTAWIGRTAIKLQGCQVRRLPAVPGTAMAGGSAGAEPPRVRFQVLVPTSDPTATTTTTTGMAAPTYAPSSSPAVVPDPTATAPSYGIYVFEVPAMLDASGTSNVAAAERERDEWMHAIDRVCVYHLYALEQQLRSASFMLQFRDILATSFPVSVPLTWLRNRLEKVPSSAGGAAMSAQQHANFQYQQLQRRSSRNLSMVQIVKDLERDRILVDNKLLISCTGEAAAPGSAVAPTRRDDGSTAVVEEHDSVAEIVKYLVGKAMTAFARGASAAAASKPTRAASGSFTKPSPSTSSTSDALGIMSPSSRLAKFNEARALAFVERVLRGSSRTQSGGDIYDAISFFCQQRNLTVCPLSHDAHPVQLNVVDGSADSETETDAFHIEIEVSMQFKVVELPAMTSAMSLGDDDAALAMASPREWAVLEGTLRRQFTLGKLSEPGSVTVTFIPDPDSTEPVPTPTS